MSVKRSPVFKVALKKPKKNEPHYGVSRGVRINKTPLWSGVKCIVKAKWAFQNLSNHLHYLQYREGKGEKELWNDKGAEEKTEFLKQFRGKGHKKYYKFIISPEDNLTDEELKLAVFKAINSIKKEYGDKIIWGAVIHSNTLHKHAHIIVRSKTDDEVYVNLNKRLLNNLKIEVLKNIFNTRENEINPDIADFIKKSIRRFKF